MVQLIIMHLQPLPNNVSYIYMGKFPLCSAAISSSLEQMIRISQSYPG